MSKVHSLDDAIRLCAELLSPWCDAYVISGRGRDASSQVAPADDTYMTTIRFDGDPILCREISKDMTMQLCVLTGEMEWAAADEDEDE